MKTKKLKYTIIDGEIWSDDWFIEGGRLYQCHSFEFSGEIIDKSSVLHDKVSCKKVIINN